MDIRYGANQRDMKTYDTQSLREEFLIEALFIPGDITMTYSHIDRIIIAGATPTDSPLGLEKNIDSKLSLGSDYFLARREMGIINIGEKGTVTVDDHQYTMNRFDALYIGKENKTVTFSSDSAATPAKFYICSAPAHKTYPNCHVDITKAKKVPAGDTSESNKRVINQLIHPDVMQTCQLMMGLTELEVGNVWNTMPAHTHERRMEVYMYFDVSEEDVVFHLMGEPCETRHIIMTNEQAIISPSWSIHSGIGTRNYKFIWAMVGENQTFTDMDFINKVNLK